MTVRTRSSPGVFEIDVMIRSRVSLMMVDAVRRRRPQLVASSRMWAAVTVWMLVCPGYALAHVGVGAHGLAEMVAKFERNGGQDVVERGEADDGFVGGMQDGEVLGGGVGVADGDGERDAT